MEKPRKRQRTTDGGDDLFVVFSDWLQQNGADFEKLRFVYSKQYGKAPQLYMIFQKIFRLIRLQIREPRCRKE